MKTRLVVFLLSFFYLSCIDLYSQEPCKVLKQEISEKYNGKCKKGLATGKGSAEGKDKYEGQFKNGLPHGKGKYIFASGEVYEGKWKEGKKEGEGKLFFKVNGVDSVRHGIWSNDVFVRKIVPSPYKVVRSNGVSRYVVHHKKEGARVLFSFMQNSGPNTSLMNLLFTPSSGSSYTLGALQGFDNVKFPFTCKITYNTLSSLKTNTYYVEFEIEIREPGEWEVILYNM